MFRGHATGMRNSGPAISASASPTPSRSARHRHSVASKPKLNQFFLCFDDGCKPQAIDINCGNTYFTATGWTWILFFCSNTIWCVLLDFRGGGGRGGRPSSLSAALTKTAERRNDASVLAMETSSGDPWVLGSKTDTKDRIGHCEIGSSDTRPDLILHTKSQKPKSGRWGGQYNSARGCWTRTSSGGLW